jgi:hypothetical protein
MYSLFKVHAYVHWRSVALINDKSKQFFVRGLGLSFHQCIYEGALHDANLAMYDI